MTYVPSHLHTTNGSIGDSIVKIPELVKKAKQLNIPAICVTNHGSLADMYDFYFECISNDIKPIIGCEVYTTDDRMYKEKDARKTGHLILLAKNNIGLKNLLAITADSQLNGFYYKPRTDYDFLEQTDTNGLIATTACLGSDVNKYILKDDLEEAKKLICRLNNIFDDFFLEIQPGDFDEQRKVNKALVKLSRELNIPLIASNDIHYLNKGDYLAHDNHVKNSRKQKDNGKLCYPDKCYYLMEKDELIESLSRSVGKAVAIEAVNNTLLLDKMCNITIKVNGLNLPDFECPKNLSPKTYLEYVCLKKLDKIKDKISNVIEYTDRMYKELDVIDKLYFSSYFLIVRDFMQYAKDNDIPYGPGRGSVCGSLVAYLADITKIDPIKYDLLFDRFLSVHRTGSIPDSNESSYMGTYSVKLCELYYSKVC